MDWVAELEKLWVPTPGRRVKTMSEEWKLARRGRLTASSRARSIAGPRAVSNFPKLRDKIMAELRPDYVWVEQQFPATEWGNANERAALSTLELNLGLDEGESFEPGFILHRKRPYVGCTPDLIIDQGEWRTAVQVKCPHDPKVHKKTLHTKKFDKTYYYQIQWEGWVAGADALLFVSFNPRLKRAEDQLVRIDIPVDRELRQIFERRCDEFRAFVEAGVVKSRPMDLDSLANAF